MKNYLKMIPALVFAFSTCVAVAQTSNTTTKQTTKSGKTSTTTNTKSATRTESAVGAPTRADDQMNEGNPGNPENKATSIQAGNNNASQAIDKKAIRKNTKANATRKGNGTTSGMTQRQNKRDNLAASDAGTMNMRGTNRAGGMDASPFNRAYDWERNLMATQLQLMNDKMRYMNQKMELMSSVMMKEKKAADVRPQLKHLSEEIEALDNQMKAAEKKAEH